MTMGNAGNDAKKSEGGADNRFARVRDVFERQLGDGIEIGASLCVTIDGKPVVDLWGGWSDVARTRRWTEDTIVNVYSVSKTMLAITALMLADRGAIDFDKSVAFYWPEFACCGKDGVKVSHLMCHASGLSGWRSPMMPADLFDWTKATRLLAEQEPFWQPGTASGYHGITQGFLVGEVVRRATGEMLGDIFKREISEPLGADFHLTLDAADDHRVAELSPPVVTRPAVEPTELSINRATNPLVTMEDTRSREWRAAPIYAVGGLGNGRSIARINALMANGGELDGKRIISEAGCRKALKLQVEGDDLCLLMPARFGMGFGLPGPWLEVPNPDSLFWPGAGGALSFIDMSRRMSFGYAMNRIEMGPFVNSRAHELLKACWRAMAS